MRAPDFLFYVVDYVVVATGRPITSGTNVPDLEQLGEPGFHLSERGLEWAGDKARPVVLLQEDGVERELPDRVEKLLDSP